MTMLRGPLFRPRNGPPVGLCLVSSMSVLWCSYVYWDMHWAWGWAWALEIATDVTFMYSSVIS